MAPPPWPTPKKWQQTFVLHTQKNSASFVLCTQKSMPKSRPKKVGKKAAKMAAKIVGRKVGIKFIPEPVLLLLETSLKPVLFLCNMYVSVFIRLWQFKKA